MAIQLRLSLWHPFRKFARVSDDSNSSSNPKNRTLLFQLVESEMVAADALLDLGDLEGYQHHFGKAAAHAEDLRGPENMLMHQRLNQLKDKRAAYRPI